MRVTVLPSMVLLLLGAAQILAARPQSGPTPSTIPPVSPQSRSPQGASPPGTQDDRQIPDAGANRSSSPSDRNNSSTANNEQALTKSSFGEKAGIKAASAVRLGELAQSNSDNKDVRDLGKMMVATHRGAFTKISSLLHDDSGKVIGNKPDAGDQAVYERLARLTGDAFDREFTAQIVSDLRETISDYQQEAAGTDQIWRTFAAEYLPTLQKEVEKAETLVQDRTNRQSTPTPTRARRGTWA